MDERVELVDVLRKDEQILCELKPHRFCYCVLPLLKMLPIAILWGCFDVFFIVHFIQGAPKSMLLFLIPFFAIHLFPCYSIFIMFAKRRMEWKNIQYAMTTQRILAIGGAVGVEVKAIDHHEIDHVNMTISWIEKLNHVGTLHIQSDRNQMEFISIENPVKIYKLLSKTSFDVKTDIEYPNALRPDQNPGYKTHYKP